MFKTAKRLLFPSNKTNGFTLIELLVIIAVLGVLAAGIMYGIDPVDRINSANDAKVQNALSEIGRASDAFAVRNIGGYADSIEDMVNAGAVKTNPSPPQGYPAYNYLATDDLGGACTSEAQNCTTVIITSLLKSRKYQATPYQRVEVKTSKICQVPLASDPCP